MKKREFSRLFFSHRFFQGYGFGIVVSVALHVLILMFLSGSWSNADELKTLIPKSIKARVVEVSEPKPAPIARPKPVVDDSAARKRVQAEAERKKQKAIERRRAEEKRRKEIALKQKREAEEKARQEKLKDKAKQEAKKEAARKERERLKKIADEKKRDEKKRKEQEAERLRQFELQQEAQRAAAAEQAEKDLAETTYYSEWLRSLFAQRWNRPPSARNNMETVVQLTLSSYGDLLEVRLLEGSGNDAYDRSVIQAVQSAAPFPELRKLERRVFNEHFKRINFKFRPEDLVR